MGMLWKLEFCYVFFLYENIDVEVKVNIGGGNKLELDFSKVS